MAQTWRSGNGPVVVMSDVWAGYATDDVLQGVTLQVPAGRAVAVVGASGSGKSTLLYAIAGLVGIRSGEVRVAGRPVQAMEEEERSQLRRQSMGFVFQFGELVPELSLAENVALPLRLNGMRRRAAERAARQGLHEVGLAEVAGRRAGQVSGGQAQRAAVLRAVIHEPALVLADEPTGALDTENAEKVLTLLFDLVRRRGSSLMLVTHDQKVAARADSIVTFSDGRAGDAQGRRAATNAGQ